MARSIDPSEGCHHNRAPLRRLGKITHERTGLGIYVLLCTECGFTVTTDQLRRKRSDGTAVRRRRPRGRAPRWSGREK